MPHRVLTVVGSAMLSVFAGITLAKAGTIFFAVGSTCGYIGLAWSAWNSRRIEGKSRRQRAEILERDPDAVVVLTDDAE